MDFRQKSPPSKFLILLLTVVLGTVSSNVVAEISSSEIQNLESDYRSISKQFYSTLVKNLDPCKKRIHSIEQLNLKLQELTKQNKSVIGVCLIQNNLPQIIKNIDSKEIFPIIQFLLDRNNLLLANKIYQAAKNEGDSSLISNISFIYAQYYSNRKEWEKTLTHVKGTYNDLTAENADLARIYTGIALQKLKKHRPAIKIYSQIAKQSKYYPAARLNIAIAYIRQDWWTDAHIEINSILKNKSIKKNSEMINRLYLVLGYSLLHKEFYRDSREAFRNIEIDSKYFNKALLGISLTATNQEDYIGALNAVNILKKKQDIDLSVDESHLLLPYIYEKLNKNLTASASYTDAQSYYQNRIKKINKIKTNNKVTAAGILSGNKFNIENNIIDFSENIPFSIIKNSVRLEEFSNYEYHIKSKKTLKKYYKVKDKHKTSLSKMVNYILDNRLTYLNSYMNQSRFGLARLFDNSNTEKN